MNNSIPEAAVEAAAHTVRLAAWGHITPEEAAREILEAAAPHMLEGAYTDGYCDGMSGESHSLDKYRATK